MRWTRGGVPIAVVFLAVLSRAEVAAAALQAADLFLPAAPERVAPLPEVFRRGPAVVVRQRYAALNFDYFAAQVASSGKVTATLFDDVRVVLDTARVTRTDGMYAWTSQVEAKFFGRAALVLDERGARGTIQVDGKVYEIFPAGAGIVSISEIDPSQFPNEGPTVVRPGTPPAAAPPPASAGRSTAPVVITVLVLLPLPPSDPFCQGTLPITLQMEAAAYQQNLNGVYGIFPATAVQAAVSAACVDYSPKGGSLSADLEWLETDSTVAALRNQYTADLVSLQVPSGDSCGLGTLGPGESLAFSVVRADCALSNYSFAHETGHNVGMNHDRLSEQNFRSDGCAFGYVAPDNLLRTVMAYGSACNECPRVGTYSTPQSLSTPPLLLGPFGVACNSPGINLGIFNGTIYARANNLQQLIDAAPEVSGFR